MTANPTAPIAPAVALPLKLDAQGRLDDDISCRKCAYNLRSLSPDGRCPECGTAVGRSLQGDFLKFADPQWVQTLASGMNWLLVSILLAFIFRIVDSAVAGANQGESLIGNMMQLGVSLIRLVGYWKLTTPDPVGLENSSSITARRLARITQSGALLLSAAVLVTPKSSGTLLLALAVLLLIAALVGLYAVLTYARQLALRIPDQRLAGQCRIIMWGFTGTWGTGLVLLLAAAIFGPAVAPALCVVALGVLVFGIWSILLILRFRTALKDEARLAAATWAAGLPPR